MITSYYERRSQFYAQIVKFSCLQSDLDYDAHI